MKFSVKNVFKSLFTVISLYLWVLIPSIRICLTPVLGQNKAESIALSMTLFCPVQVSFSENIPSSFEGMFLYYVNRSIELITFSTAFFIGWCLKSITGIINFILVAILTTQCALICSVWVRGSIGEGILPALAALCGMVLARCFFYDKK